MCECKGKCICICEDMEKLKDKPSECTPEQIKECHGEANEHTCVQKEK